MKPVSELPLTDPGSIWFALGLVWLGFGCVWVCFGLALELSIAINRSWLNLVCFGFGLGWMGFALGWLGFGFGLLWVCSGLALVVFGFALGCFGFVFDFTPPLTILFRTCLGSFVKFHVKIKKIMR